MSKINWPQTHAAALVSFFKRTNAARVEHTVISEDETYVVTVCHKAVDKETSNTALRFSGARQLLKAMTADKLDHIELTLHLEGVDYTVKVAVKGEEWRA